MTSSIVPSPYPMPGDVLDGKYKVEKVLGEGGMGCVVRALHILLRAPVALKFMNPQFMSFPGAVDRFLNEGVASKAIVSDHVVAVEDVGKLPNGAPYLVMPCLDGMDLSDLLARDGTPGLPVERSVYFVLQILRGLQAAHSIGIIHRDMKPSNAFVVDKDGESDFVKLLDFGISKVQQPGSGSLTQTNSALGTPLYMSPEQARSPRDVDARSDLYSVGVILYELLTGHTPFTSESGEFTEILFQLFTADPPPVQSTRPDLPDELAAVVHKLLAREPADRYASAIDVAAALEPWAGARSQVLLKRIREFKPPQKVSIVPRELLPPSMEAFSELGMRTDVMANRPTTDIQKGAPVTQAMDGAPAGKAGTAVMQQPALTPQQRAGTEKTAFDVTGESTKPPKTPGVSTDLGAAIDAEGEEPKRAAWVYALPIAALVMVAGFFFVLFGPLGKKDPVPTAPPPVTPSFVPSAALSTAPPPVKSTEAPAIASSAPPAESAPKAATKTPVKPPSTNPTTQPNNEPNLGLGGGIAK